MTSPNLPAQISALYTSEGKPSPLLKSCINHVKDRLREVVTKGAAAGNVKGKPKASSATVTNPKGASLQFCMVLPVSDDSDATEKMRDVILISEGRLLTPTMAKAGFQQFPSAVADPLALFYKMSAKLPGIVVLKVGAAKAGKLEITAHLIFHTPDSLVSPPAPEKAPSKREEKEEAGLSESDWKADLRKLFSDSEAVLAEQYVLTYRNAWRNVLRYALKMAGEEPESRDWVGFDEVQKVVQNYGASLSIPRDIRSYAKQRKEEKFTFIWDESETRLKANAAAWASATADQMNAKVLRKVEDLDSVERVSAKLGSLQYTVVGRRGGRSVVLSQSVTYNISSKGTPFLQFPARFHVDGKSMSEAQYKNLF
jgi:hypothetical protein